MCRRPDTAVRRPPRATSTTPTSLSMTLRGIGSQHAAGIYITQNPSIPTSWRGPTTASQRKPKQTTADADIVRLTHLTLDFDPVRPSGHLRHGRRARRGARRRDAFIQFVTTELGWPEPLVVMMSGNGGQATWRIDLPPDEGAALVASGARGGSALFSTPAVSVDTTLGNPSRIVKLSGTVAAKGDPLPGRPHRRAQSTFHPDAGTVSEEQLRALVALAPPPIRGGPAPERSPHQHGQLAWRPLRRSRALRSRRHWLSGEGQELGRRLRTRPLPELRRSHRRRGDLSVPEWRGDLQVSPQPLPGHRLAGCESAPRHHVAGHQFPDDQRQRR